MAVDRPRSRSDGHFLGFTSGILAGVCLALIGLTWNQQSSSQVLGAQTEEWVFRHGSTDQKQVALTFDDGPGPLTSELIGVLAENNVKATFFVVGQAVERSPAVVRQLVAEGHEIGNHTYSHPMWLWWSEQAIAKELAGAEEALWQAAEVRPTSIRSPYGLYFSNLHQVADREQLKVIGWSVDPEDWRQPGTDKVVQRVMDEVQPGSIILLHDGPADMDRSQTLEAVKQLIPKLTAAGYELVLVSQLR